MSPGGLVRYVHLPGATSGTNKWRKPALLALGASDPYLILSGLTQGTQHILSACAPTVMPPETYTRRCCPPCCAAMHPPQGIRDLQRVRAQKFLEGLQLSYRDRNCTIQIRCWSP